MSSVDTEILMAAYVEDNTSQGKGWISDSDSKVHVCFHKETFNSLALKEEGTVKMIDGLVCEVISTGTTNITCRGGMMLHAEVVWYASEA